MSKTVDSRVVEMRFDNSQFESNVRTSMSTLERLKQSLNLTKSAKGLEGISAAAKKVDFSGMGKGIDTVNAKFSAMQVMGVTALANITNSAINAGKRMVSALTIQPITTGFQEYETQINAIQTILANTQKEGTNVQIVNKALDELNTYADKTIYNFTEMTRNIGTFTAAGVKLQTSVDAIQGIANLAAVSGSTSQQASTAMYQLSQALATGTVRLMDWNSVVNAGMGGQVFQDALRETSELLGTGAEAAIKANGSFRESLQTGWLTSEVLTETLKKFTTSGANEYVAEYTGLSQEAVAAALEEAEARYGEADAIKYASEALAEKSGKNAQEIADILQFAKTAEDAATKVKTFSQLWDTMKEAAQSGWSQTWRLIVGDFEQAQELLTGISDFFTGDNGIITKMSNARNNLLEGALGKSFSGMADKMNKLLEPAKKAVNTVKEVNAAIADLGTVVDDVILGKFGNGQERFDALTESGYNWMKVQNQVNEKLGDSYRYTEEQIAAQDKLLGSQKETAKATSETSEETTKLTDAQKDQIKELAKLSDEQLRSKGYTKEQIEAFRELRDTADQLGLPLDTFIDKMDEINGRWLLWNSFANIGNSIMTIFGSIGKAWRDVFDPIQPEQIFNAIAAVHKFTASLIMNKDSAEDLRRTFRGLFAVLDIVTTIAGGGLKIAFEVLSTILGAFDTNILEVTGAIGDAIYKFRDWLFEQNAIAKGIDNLVSKLPEAVGQIKEWFNAFKEIPAVEKFVSAIESIIDAFNKIGSADFSLTDLAESLGKNLAKALRSIPEMVIQIGKDVIAGFQNGIEAGISGSVIGKIISFCTEFLSAFAEALGVQSPSWKTFDMAVDTMQGFINGLKSVVGTVVNFVGFVGEQIINAFKLIWELITDESGNIEWGSVFAGGLIAATGLLVKNILDIAGGISDAFGSFGDVIENAGKVMKSFSKVLNGISWNLKAKAIRNFAISIAILVGSLVVLAFIDTDKLWNGVAIIGALSAIVLGLAVAMDKMTQASAKIGKGGVSLEGLKTGLIQIGIALLLLAVTVKLIGGMDIEQAIQGFAGLTILMVEMAAFMAAVGLIGKGVKLKHISKVGSMMLKLSFSLLLMVGVVKLVSGLSAEEMIQGAVFATAFALFVRSITAVAKDSGKHVSKVGGMILKLSIAMLLMVGVVKLVGMLSAEEMLKGVAFAAAFVLFVRTLVNVTKISKEQEIAKIGGLMLATSVSLLLMAGVCKLVSGLSAEEMLKGGVFVAAFVVMLKAMMKIITVGNEQQMLKVAGTLLAMSAAIGILAGVTVLLSMISLGGLVKGIAAVGLLSVMMTGMIKALKGAQNVKGSIMMMSVAIGVMAASVVALSFVEPDKLAGATAAIAILMGMFALIEKGSKNVTKSIATLGVMAGVVAVLAAVLYVLSSLEVDSTMEVAASLSLLMMSLAVSLRLIGKTGALATSAMPAMLAMSGVLAIVAIILGVLAALNIGSTIEIAASLSLLLISLLASMTLMSVTGSVALAAMPAALAMSGVLAIIAVILGVLAALNVGPTLEIAASLSVLLLSLSAACLIMAGAAAIASVAAAGLVPMMALMVGMGALMAVIAGLVTWIPDLESFLSKALPILKLIGEGIGEFLGGIVAGIANSAMDILPRFGETLSAFMTGLQPFIAMAGSIDASVMEGVGYLAGAIIALTGANLISGIGQFLSFGQTFADLGTQLSSFITNAQPFLTGIKGIDPSAIESANMLAELIMTLTKAELLSGIGSLVSWFTGGNSFEDFGTQLTSFGNAMRSFSNSISGITLDEAAINTVVTAGTKLAELQSSLEPMGGVISWFTGERDFVTFGTQIQAFGNAMRNFSASISGIALDEASLSTVISAGTKLAELQASLEPMGGVISWFTGERDFATFGTQIVAFGNAMKNFAVAITGIVIDEASIGAVISAGTKLAELQSSLEPMGGVISWFTGERDFVTFGTQIQAFGNAISSFAGSIGEGINEAAVTSVINAGTMITELQKALPEEGWFDGKMNLTEFSNYVTDFSTAMSTFSTNASEIDSTGITTAINAAYRIRNLIESLAGLDTSGVNSFAGVGLGDGHVVNIAQAIAEYANTVAEIDTGVVSSSITSAMKLKSLIASLAGLDTSGIENFKVASIGSAMKSYNDKVAGIDAGIVSSSITSANRLKALVASLAGFDSSGISNFNVGSLGSKIKAYSDQVAGINSGAIAASVSSIRSLMGLISSMGSINTSGVGAFKSAIDQLSTVELGKLVSAFSGAGPRLAAAAQSMMTGLANGIRSSQGIVTGAADNILNTLQAAMRSRASMFNSIGTQLMTQFVNGIRSMNSQVPAAASASLSAAAASIRGYYGSFYSAGTYVASGFASGIRSRISSAASAAASMAAAASSAARANLKINSPSKVFMKIGGSVPEGFAKGIDDYGYYVKQSISSMSKTALDSTKTAISRIGDAINTDIDAQPTIRPVLDLDNIRSGAGMIDGLLNRRTSVGVDANLSAINTMMNQNGVRTDMDDVVLAINKLRKDLGNVGNTSYNINGVTYDDGSNITEAVKSIVRAARIERRV